MRNGTPRPDNCSRRLGHGERHPTMKNNLLRVLALLLSTSGAWAQGPCHTWQSFGPHGADNDDAIVAYAADRTTGDFFVALSCLSCSWSGFHVPWVVRNGQTVIDPANFFNGSIHGLEWIDDVGGGAVYVWGSKHLDPPSAWIERWNGSDFVPVVAPPFVPGALVSYDDGTGLALYAATDVGVYRETGAGWTSIGAIALAPGQVSVRLAVFDAPGGDVLVFSGPFTAVAGVVAHRIAAWNGSVWQPLGSGLSGAAPGFPEGAFQLHAASETSGPALYCGGSFTLAGGSAANGLARWDGTTWTGLGAGLPGTAAIIHGIESFDDGLGAGPRIFVKGYTSTFPFTPFLRVRAGNAWLELPAAPAGTQLSNGPIQTLRFSGQTRPSLVATLASGTLQRPTPARFDACDLTGELFCFGDGSEGPCPCGNESSVAERAGCRHSLGAAGALRARGMASLTADTLALDGSGMPNSFALYFQAGSRHAALAFGDGLSCTGGPFVRLKTLTNVLGSSSYPDPGSAPISVRGGVDSPGTRHYQVRYRNAATSFCMPATFNYTSGVTIAWQL